MRRYKIIYLSVTPHSLGSMEYGWMTTLNPIRFCWSIQGKADTLVFMLKDIRLRLKLGIKCRGQCYDGAANMSGSGSGTAVQILKEET